MYILDTDILNVIFHQPHSSNLQLALKNKLEKISDRELWISVISVYEIMFVGILPEINKKMSSPAVVDGFNALLQAQHNFSEYQILPYTAEDDRAYRTIPQGLRKRLGLDCRIAASAGCRSNCTIVTRNIKDYTKLQNYLTFGLEDWTTTATP